MLIVGQPGAGKTTLLKTILDPTYIVPQGGDKKVESTLGVNIEEGWTFKHPDAESETVKVNIWDFGGQEIQYMTHHFFITPRALYVLVADDRKQNTYYDYWFRIINLLGKEKEGEKIKVLIVLNEINHRSVTNFDMDTYQKKYPDLELVKRDVDFSVKDGRCGALHHTIKTMLYELPEVHRPLPLLWKPIREDLIRLRQDHHHINYRQFSEICSTDRNGISLSETNDQKLFSRYLHNLGVLQHYQEFDSLYDFIILNPQWAVEAVYSVLKDKRVLDNKGRFTAEDLKEFWTDYSPQERSHLLDLMLKDKFEICYRSQLQPDTYISPQLLPDIKPKYDWSSSDTLKFRYQYPFMPKGIFSRFIVRVNEKIAGSCQDLVWKEGVVIEDDGCQGQILLTENPKDGLKVIDIEITGATNNRKYLLHQVRKEIEIIHKSLSENMNVEQMVPCNCAMCLDHASPHFYKFTVLESYREKNRPTIVCDKSIEDVAVMQLLEGVFDRKSLTEMLRNSGREKSIPTTEYHYHGPVNQISGGQVVQSEKIERQQFNTRDNIEIKDNPKSKIQVGSESAEPTQPVPPPPPKKWYQQWWFTALVSGAVTMLLVGYLTRHFVISLLTGIGVFLWMMWRNPKYWLIRMANIALTAAIGSLVFNFSIKYSYQKEGETLDISILDTPVLLSIGLLIFAAICVIAQKFGKQDM